MTLDEYPGTLPGEKYAGSPPQAHALDGPAQTGSLPLATDARGTLPATRYAGSQPQLHSWGTAHRGSLPIGDTKGTLPRGRRFPQDTEWSYTGTFRLGSVNRDFSAGNDFVGMDPDGGLWVGEESSYIFRFGTKTLDAGTPSRLGTVTGGSISMNHVPEDLSFSEEGKLWVPQNPDFGSNRFFLIGTRGLRGAGSDNRIGTQLIGSFAQPAPQAVRASGGVAEAGGELWVGAQDGLSRTWRIGTLGLRSGTDSRMGTIKIGSFEGPPAWGQGTPSIMSAGRRLLLSKRGLGTILKLGTAALRAGTDSRQGTFRLGSVGLTSWPGGEVFSLDDPPVDGLYAIGGGTVTRFGTPAGLMQREATTDQVPPKLEHHQGFYVNVVGSFNPTTTEPSGLYLAQRGRGTLSYTTVPATGNAGITKTITGWIDPQQGSYTVGTIGVNAEVLEWAEERHTL